MTFTQHLYRMWVWFWFIVAFLILYPFFVLFIQRESWKIYAHNCNKIWAHVVFFLCNLPVKLEWRFRPDPKKSYVYCPNHSSYLDIPTLCYSLPGYAAFVGKAELAKVPLFGYMFRNLYIPVDRKSSKSKYDTVQAGFKMIDQGRSLSIFPEGTIPKGHGPAMIHFKDGPFRIAVEKQIPIIPITIPYNWIILPDDGKFLPRRHLMKTIIHEPIETLGLTATDIPALKEKVFNIIEAELKKHNPEVTNWEHHRK